MNLHEHDIRYEAHAEGHAEGLAEGTRLKAEEDARSFYANGASVELIAKSLHMTEEQVLKILKEPVPVKK